MSEPSVTSLPVTAPVDAEPYVFVDEPNPMGLAIYHPTGVCTASDGGCRPRILVDCTGCDRSFNHCYPSAAELAALKRFEWRCADCGGV